MTVTCPNCEEDISETFQGAEPDVGIMSGGWYCDACDIAVGEDEVSEEPFDDDVAVGPAPRDPAQPIGTPISELSGRPGHPGYEQFKRIAKSWGYD